MPEINDMIKDDILTILNKALSILDRKEDKDIIELKSLSNPTIHNASIFQDEFSVSIAILIYALSKIISRSPEGFDYKLYKELLKDAENALKSDNRALFSSIIRKLINMISKQDAKLKLYISEVITQAQIKKGSGLYHHGISLERASNLLGISQWELMEYIGKTKQADMDRGQTNVRQRLIYARRLFS